MSRSVVRASDVQWKLAAFEALTAHDLYALLQLRSEVFVLEQACLFQDLDGRDERALHLMGWMNGELAAYARCFGPGIQFAEASIGRIVTRHNARGVGLGHVLVTRAITVTRDTWGAQAIRIGAQARLKEFYEGHAFVDAGLPYVEDGIDHLEMVWSS